MPNDPFYRSTQWRALRAAVLKRDQFRCVVPGCGAAATVVDHIISRRAGGADQLSNLRSLCKAHDGKIKEAPRGKRRNNGQLVAFGCDASGWPTDPRHHWRKS